MAGDIGSDVRVAVAVAAPLVGEEGAAEPYRYLMKNLRSRLMATQAWLEARLKGEELPKPEGLLTQNEELWEPLYACYQSLQACGMGIIANGDLLDTLRRVKCFGVPPNPIPASFSSRWTASTSDGVFAIEIT